jgi:hypothetical protein
MSASALANVVTQALSVAQLCSAVWRTMEEAESALRAFSATQGWSLATRKSAKYQYKLRDAQGEERPGEEELFKVWICSRGHQRQANEPHICTDSAAAAAATAAAAAASSSDSAATGAADDKACDMINSAGQLVSPSSAFPRLPASTKTGCPVSVRVVMLKKAAPTNGIHWTEQDTPCAGYKLATAAKLLLPCQHNHSSHHCARGLTESVSQIPDTVRQEVKELVLANFPSYRIRNYISTKHQLPSLVPAVWNSLIRAIKTELGIHDAGEDLQTLIERLTKERNDSGAVFDLTVDGDMTVTTIFFMSRAMVASFRRCAQFVVMDSTCKTNRFGMSLFIVCGVDEHMHIALYATAFMKDETQPSFEYVLTQLRRAVGLDAWLRMACAATDGCAAMTAALTKAAPHTAQQRCVWHLQQNIIKHTGGSSHQLIVKAWYKCVYAKFLPEFEKKWAELLQVKMTEHCREYLTKYIFPLRTKWSAYSTGSLTNFGSHSTQLVESLNRLLKMWDVNDRTSLSRAVERICTVKEEEETRRQIAAMKDHSVLSVVAGPAAQIQMHDAYKTKVRKLLTGAAAMLCEAQYDLFSQYKVIRYAASSTDLFSLATQVYIVKHKVEESSEHQVHVSPHLIYCPCGFFTAYLLPCRHVLAANGAAFADVFQVGQHHPRWWLQYSSAMQHELLSKQFWVSVGHEVTSDGLKRVRYNLQQQRSAKEGKEAAMEEEEEEEEEKASAGLPRDVAAAVAAASLLPSPMYSSSSQELLPTQMTPQQLYHMIEGKCASLRQLACTNPAKLSGLVWMELHQAELRITQHIDREQRMQQQLHISAAAAATGGLTSEGFPLSALLAPVPLTSTKPGRPSNKRSRAAIEGVAARKIRATLPAHLQQLGRGEEAGGLDQAATSVTMSNEVHASSVFGHSAVVAAAAAAAGAAGGTAGGAAAVAAAVCSGSASFAAASGAAVYAGGGNAGCAAAGVGNAGCAAVGAAAAVRVSERGRVPRRAPFE